MPLQLRIVGTTVVPVKRDADTYGAVVRSYGTIVVEFAFDNLQVARLQRFLDVQDSLCYLTVSLGEIHLNLPEGRIRRRSFLDGCRCGIFGGEVH